MDEREPPVTPDPWSRLKRFTGARIALGRSGGSLPTRAWLDFKLAHARARDAVHHPFEVERLAAQIEGLGVATLIVASGASERRVYLERPDLGRRLDRPSRKKLESAEKGFDLVIIVSDGLSALAVHRHTAPLLSALLPRLERDACREEALQRTEEAVGLYRELARDAGRSAAYAR